MYAPKEKNEKMPSFKLREAIATSRLENLVLSHEDLEDLFLVDQGKMSPNEYIKKAIKQATSNG